MFAVRPKPCKIVLPTKEEVDMRTQEEKEKAQRFWQRVDILKNEKFPSSTWGLVCEKAGINFNTLRSAKCYGSLPNDRYIDALATLFGVSRENLVSNEEESKEETRMFTALSPSDDLLKRRQTVAIHVFDLDEQMFYAVERLMGLSPSIQYVNEEVKIYGNK